MLRLHDYLSSGNCYKVRLLLAQLGRPYERVDVDIMAGRSRTPEFLRKNPNGRVPVLELESGECLAESNAILWYLAEDGPFLPGDRLARARVLQWMCFEQYEHEPTIAVVRFAVTHDVPLAEWQRAALDERRTKGTAALGVMERHLAAQPFFVGDAYTIADVALYAYTHVAPEGGFDLGPYPAVRAWLARVAAQPRHVPITAT